MSSANGRPAAAVAVDGAPYVAVTGPVTRTTRVGTSRYSPGVDGTVTATAIPPFGRRFAATGATTSPACSGTTRSMVGSVEAVVPGSSPATVGPAVPAA